MNLEDLKSSNVENADEGGLRAEHSVEGFVNPMYNPLEETLIECLCQCLAGEFHLHTYHVFQYTCELARMDRDKMGGGGGGDSMYITLLDTCSNTVSGLNGTRAGTRCRNRTLAGTLAQYRGGTLSLIILHCIAHLSFVL